jgi:hypothetical protein
MTENDATEDEFEQSMSPLSDEEWQHLYNWQWRKRLIKPQ